MRFIARWLLLGGARIAIAVVPFSRIARILGNGNSAADPRSPIGACELGRAAWIGAATERAAMRTPWRSECLTQAVACALQLRLVGTPHTVRFGVRRDAGELLAHAWVTVGPHVVLGGDPSAYSVVRSFGWQPGSNDRGVRGELPLLRDDAAQRDRTA